MARREGRAMWLAAGAAVLGTATLLFRRSHVARLRAVVGARHDESSGRGRAATPPSPRARQAGHETGDLRGGTLAKLLLLLGSAALCMVFAMIGLRIWITDAQRTRDGALTAVQRTAITPPGPHLLHDPVQDLATFRAREDAMLTGFGHPGGDRTRARIPLDRAMALTVGQPLEAPP